MSTLSEIEAKIAATETKLSEAEVAKNEPLMIMYGNNLAELRHGKNQLSKSDPRQMVVKSGIAVTNWLDSTQRISIRNLYAGMPWCEFSEEMNLRLGSRFFKLYLLYDDEKKDHVKITEDNFSEILKMSIAAAKNISKPSSFRIVYFYPLSTKVMTRQL